MEIDFDHSTSRERKRPTRMMIEDMKVVYTPTVEKSVDMLFERQAGLRIFSDTMINTIETRARETARR